MIRIVWIYLFQCSKYCSWFVVFMSFYFLFCRIALSLTNLLAWKRISITSRQLKKCNGRIPKKEHRFTGNDIITNVKKIGIHLAKVFFSLVLCVFASAKSKMKYYIMNEFFLFSKYKNRNILLPENGYHFGLNKNNIFWFLVNLEDTMYRFTC